MNVKVGMNLLLFGPEIDEHLFPVLEQIKEIGFDGVEVPIFDVNPDVWFSWRKKLDELGLDRIAVTINGSDFNQISPDATHRKSTLERNKRAIDCAVILDSKLLTGPFHSALGVFTGKAPTKEELNWAKENLWELAEYADSMGIVLALEYLNRFESYLATSTDELMELVNEINHPACKVMFDTFHANIEEKSLFEAVQKMDEKLVHVQFSENDRGTLGAGHINFEEVLIALKSINYNGMISIEAFSEKLAVANVWRKLFESEEQLMRDSYAYLKKALKIT